MYNILPKFAVDRLCLGLEGTFLDRICLTHFICKDIKQAITGDLPGEGLEGRDSSFAPR
jgi:hypothetical protein